MRRAAAFLEEVFVMPKRNVKRMCYAALLAAMYLPLSLYAAVDRKSVCRERV